MPVRSVVGQQILEPVVQSEVDEHPLDLVIPLIRIVLCVDKLGVRNGPQDLRVDEVHGLVHGAVPSPEQLQWRAALVSEEVLAPRPAQVRVVATPNGVHAEPWWLLHLSVPSCCIVS